MHDPICYLGSARARDQRKSIAEQKSWGADVEMHSVGVFRLTRLREAISVFSQQLPRVQR